MYRSSLFVNSFRQCCCSDSATWKRAQNRSSAVSIQ